MQKNWIGRSEGLSLRWQTVAGTVPEGFADITVYTTRPDTLFGASFTAIAADHPLARELSEKNPDIAEFCDECRRHGTSLAALETAEKKGIDTGVKVVHPLDPTWELPVYVANFVLMDYGTGAIFGCPSGDQRDLDFARKYDLPVVAVVAPEGPDAASFTIQDVAFTDDGVMINSGFLNGMNTTDAFEAVVQKLSAQTLGNTPQAERKVNFRLRDWGISRQRYWGCPIPVIHCEVCGVVPVPKKDLPVKLPDDVTFDVPGNPLDRHPHGVTLPARNAAMTHAVKPTRWTHSSIPAGTTRASPRLGKMSRRIRRPQTTGCRWTSISAASSMLFCTCSIRASSPAPCARPAMSASRSPSRACSRRAWLCTRPIATVKA